MGKNNNLFIIFICCLLCFASFVSCSIERNDDNDKYINENEIINNTHVLTNVFKGKKVTISDEYSVNDNVLPYYNNTTKEMTILCSHRYESDEKNEDDSRHYIRENILVTFALDGKVVNETKLKLDDNTYINNGILMNEKLYFIKNEYNEETEKEFYYIAVYDRNTDKLILSDEISKLFNSTKEHRSWFYIDNIAVDGEGYVYLNSGNEIIVLDENFDESFTVLVDDWADRLITTIDGTVYIEGYFEEGQAFLPINKDAKSFGDKLTLPDNLKISQYYFGNGFDIYYIDKNETGLYGYNFSSEISEQNEEGTLLFDFANSDLYADNFEIAKIINQDKIIVYERDFTSYDQYMMIYNRAEDIDLSRIKVLEVAYTSSDYDLASDIIAYNKGNSNVRIIAHDYSVYDTNEEPNAGTQKLLNDILNGLYKPDMITANSMDDSVLRQVYDNNLYVDLYSFIDKSTKIDREDILGCVIRTFETEEDKLWAIGPSFDVNTLIGPRSLLGNRTGWSLSEMVEFAKSLPPEGYLIENLNQESATSDLLGINGYAMFIDTETGICDFENKEFYNYLEYLKTLPENREEARAALEVNSDERYLLYHNNQIALKKAVYSGIEDWVSDEADYNTKDIVRIGYPTSDGVSNGSYIYITPYVITSFCEYPNEAWAFIESIIVPDTTENMNSGVYEGFPILKSSLNRLCEEYYTYFFEIDIDGSGMSWGTYDPEQDDLRKITDEPIIRKLFTKEDAVALTDWLNNEVGYPVLGYIDDEISDIINEEISGYLSGIKTAEDCAHIIQSRVSIWLAEHS